LWVLVPVTVTDATDRPVNDLPVDAFRLLEDNVEQKIVSFWREEAPVSVGFVFDASSSMQRKLDRSVAAVKQFLETTIPGDEILPGALQRPTISGESLHPGRKLRLWDLCPCARRRLDLAA
jgi:hypothetical protein